MLIEGRNPLMELLKSDKAIDKVLIEKGAENSGSGINIMHQIRDKGVKYQFVPKAVIDGESVTKAHQGFIAYVEDFEYTELADIIAYAESLNEDPFIVILDEIQDPHNLGSIIRVCECAGCHGIVIPKFRSVSVNETVVKVSAGASSHMKIARVTNIKNCIDTLKEQGFWIYGGDSGGESMYKADLKGKLALVIGSEGEGMKKLTKESCDKILSIPMYGKVNSLNASVACGILVYEADRQRKLFKGT